VELARSSVAARSPCTVLYHNLHSLYCWFRSETLRRHYAGATVLVDGMPVIGLLRAAGFDVSREQRVTYVDLIMPLLRMARDNGFRVYHIGQSADIGISWFRHAATGGLAARAPRAHRRAGNLCLRCVHGVCGWRGRYPAPMDGPPGLGVEFSAVRKPAPLCVSLRRRAGVAGRLPGTWLVHIETFGSCC